MPTIIQFIQPATEVRRQDDHESARFDFEYSRPCGRTRRPEVADGVAKVDRFDVFEVEDAAKETENKDGDSVRSGVNVRRSVGRRVGSYGRERRTRKSEK